VKRLALIVSAFALLAGGISDGAWAHPNDSCPFIGATQAYYTSWGYGAAIVESTCQWDPYGIGYRTWGPGVFRILWGHL